MESVRHLDDYNPLNFPLPGFDLTCPDFYKDLESDLEKARNAADAMTTTDLKDLEEGKTVDCGEFFAFLDTRLILVEKKTNRKCWLCKSKGCYEDPAPLEQFCVECLPPDVAESSGATNQSSVLSFKNDPAPSKRKTTPIRLNKRPLSRPNTPYKSPRLIIAPQQASNYTIESDSDPTTSRYFRQDAASPDRQLECEEDGEQVRSEEEMPAQPIVVYSEEEQDDEECMNADLENLELPLGDREKEEADDIRVDVEVMQVDQPKETGGESDAQAKCSAVGKSEPEVGKAKTPEKTVKSKKISKCIPRSAW